MATQYFPIFQFVKKSHTDATSEITIKSNAENTCEKRAEKDNNDTPECPEAELHCMMCFEKCIFNIDKNGTDNDDEYFLRSTDVFETCLKMLKVQMIAPMRWNFRYEVLPFCKKCMPVLERVTKLNNQLNFVKKQIKKTLLDIKIKIIKSQDQNLKRMTVPCGKKRGVVGSAPYSEKVDYFRSLAIRDFDPDVQLWRKNILFETKVDYQSDISRVSSCDSKKNSEDLVVERTSTSPIQKSASSVLSEPDFVISSTIFEEKNIPYKLTDPKPASTKKSKINTELVKKTDSSVESNVFPIPNAVPVPKKKQTIKNNPVTKKRRFSRRKLSARNKPEVDDFVSILSVEKTSQLEAKKNFRKIGSNFWQCKLCQQHLARSSNSQSHTPNFSRHINQVHKKLKPYQCSLCMNLYTSITSCRSHVQNVHLSSVFSKIVLPTSNSKVISDQQVPVGKLNEVKRDDSKSSLRRRQKLKRKTSSVLITGDTQSSKGGSKMEQQKVGNRVQTDCYDIFFEKKDVYHCCKLCASQILMRSNLKRHVLTQHGPLSKFMCTFCSNIFPLNHDLETHMKNDHLGETNHSEHPTVENENAKVAQKVISDEDCESKTLNIKSNDNEMYQHDEMHHIKSNSDKLISRNNVLQQCDGQNFAKEPSSKPSSPKKEKKSYPAHIERGIVSENMAAQHLAKYSLKKGKEKICKTCNKKFLEMSKLFRHIIQVHKVAGVGYQCKYCKHRYYSKSDCAVHIRVQHYMEKPFDCAFCKISFCSRGGRRLHQLNCGQAKSIDTLLNCT